VHTQLRGTSLPIIKVRIEEIHILEVIVAYNPITPDLVRYEMKMVQGQNPHEREQKRPGRFGRFLSGIGKVLGAIAMPMSFIFPPAAIAAAGMYGIGAIGDGAQKRAYAKAAEKQQRESMTRVAFPGLDVGMGGASQIRPAAGSFSAGDMQVMQVLDARGGTVPAMTGSII